VPACRVLSTMQQHAHLSRSTPSSLCSLLRSFRLPPFPALATHRGTPMTLLEALCRPLLPVCLASRKPWRAIALPSIMFRYAIVIL
jgi:hypothetical protein